MLSSEFPQMIIVENIAKMDIIKKIGMFFNKLTLSPHSFSLHDFSRARKIQIVEIFCFSNSGNILP